MEEEFIASIKLTSGEEIIATVCYDPNDDAVVVLHPKLVEKVEIDKPNVIIESIVFDDWIIATQEDMFIIPRSQIITMIEIEDKFAEYYIEHLNDKSKYRKKQTEVKEKRIGNRLNPREQEGFLGSIKEAKAYLENLYKL